MKNKILALGICLELTFLSFYLIKHLTLKWGVSKLYLADNRVFLLTAIILSIAFGVYVISGILISKYKVKFKHIFLFSVLFNLSLLFVWNIASNDLYTHIQRGRMVAKYGVSPYVTPYDRLSYDEFYEETRTIWSGQVSIYGPAFTLFGAFISSIARESLLTHIIIYKLIYTALNILIGYYIYRITKNVLASFLYSWNPAIIFEIQMNNHFEVLVIFPMVYALYLLISRVNWKRYVFSLSILTLGSLTKFFTLIIYPFYLLYALKKLRTVKEKLKFLVVGGFIQLLIIFLCYLPFMDNLGISEFLLLANGTFASPSITILVLMKLFELINSDQQTAQVVAQSAFRIYYIFLGIKSLLVARFVETNVFVKTLVLVFAGFTLVYLNLITPWYTLSLLTLVVIYYGLSKETKYAVFSYLLTIYSFFLYIRVI